MLFRHFKGGDVRTDAGRAEDKVVVKAVQIMLSHLQLHAPLLQFGFDDAHAGAFDLRGLDDDRHCILSV